MSMILFFHLTKQPPSSGRLASVNPLASRTHVDHDQIRSGKPSSIGRSHAHQGKHLESSS